MDAPDKNNRGKYLLGKKKRHCLALHGYLNNAMRKFFEGIKYFSKINSWI